MFKKKLYNEIVRVLNEETTQGLVFNTGYERVQYANGISCVVDVSSGNQFEYKKVEVIPVTEEFSQETASVNGSDRSDYTCQYQISYALKNKDKVETSLSEFRDYFFTNKHFTIDDYNVTVKTIRGNKIGTIGQNAGNDIGRYVINAYFTASKGYLIKPSDKWQIRNVTQDTVFVDMPLIDETCNNNITISPKTNANKTAYSAEEYNLTKTFTLYYDDSTFVQEVYDLIVIGGTSDVYQLRNIFNEDTKPSENVIISSCSRTTAPNSPLLLTVSFVTSEV